MTWKEEIINALEHLGGEAHLSEIYEYISAHTDRKLSTKWKATVRGTLESASSDSARFEGDKDLFYSAEGLGSGVWGLRSFEPTTETMDITQDDSEFAEGREKLAIHVQRERNHQVITLAKQRKLQKCGRLYCEVCGFDFEKVYGEIGKNFIEAHHIKPVSQLMPNEKTRVEDIVLLCSNCHSMIHRKKPWLTVDQLSTLRTAK